NHIGVFMTRFKRSLNLEGKGKQAEYQDQRNQGEKDFDWHVVAHLRRQTSLSFTTTVCNDCEDNESPHDNANTEQNNPGIHPKSGDCIGMICYPGFAWHPSTSDLF